MDVLKFINTLDIPTGSRWRGNCPSCNGVNTLNVTNDMGTMLYNCYKASCNLHGGVHTGMSADDIRTMLRNRIEETVVHTTFEQPANLVHMRDDFTEGMEFCEVWDIDPADVLYDVREDRVVFPVYDNNKIVDAVGRAMHKAQFKWKRYGKANHPYTAKGADSRYAVLVEDAISAYRVPKLVGVDGVALLGTALTTQHREYVAKHYEGVIVALDRDALDKQIAIRNDLSTYVDVVKVVRLSDDLKYAEEVDADRLQILIEEMQ